MKPNAGHAITTLTRIQTLCGSDILAYWVLPNVILTLSGARAYCDGIFWSNNQKILSEWNKDISRSLDVLKSCTSVLIAKSGIQSVRNDETYASYDLIFKEGLDFVLSKTNLINKEQLDLSDPRITSTQLQQQFKIILSKNKKLKGFNEEDIDHIYFGILLGYPDEAITESVHLWSNQDPFAEKLIDADIKGAGYYINPQPVYSYPRKLINNPKINVNERLWSKILDDYYHSDFHKALEKDVGFQEKMKELGNLW
jgi:hypothetical protein